MVLGISVAGDNYARGFHEPVWNPSWKETQANTHLERHHLFPRARNATRQCSSRRPLCTRSSEHGQTRTVRGALTRRARRFKVKLSQTLGYMRVVWPRLAPDSELQGMGCSGEVYQR